MGAFLARPFGLLLELLYSLVGNYGISIILLSLVIRLAMYPIYKKQITSTSNMAELQKKQQEIQKKYANDKETMNLKLSELYKENGSPMAGCLPMIIQLIVISGLFILLRYPLNYISADDKMVFAVHESFLWMKDLSQPDLWILPILSGIATYLSFSMSQMGMPQQAGNPMGGKAMKFVFPIMIVWLARTYPAGLAIYWFISQVTQVFFNLRFNKLRQQMKDAESMKKAKKKVKTA